MKTYVADLRVVENSTMMKPWRQTRERVAPPSTRTRTDLDDDSRAPRSSRNSGSENFWVETRSTTVHRGLEVSRIRYPNLGRRTSGGGDVEVDPGRSLGQPEFNSEFS